MVNFTKTQNSPKNSISPHKKRGCKRQKCISLLHVCVYIYIYIYIYGRVKTIIRGLGGHCHKVTDNICVHFHFVCAKLFR